MSSSSPKKVKLLELDKPTPTGRIYTSEAVRKWLEDPRNTDRDRCGLYGELGQSHFFGENAKPTEVLRIDPENVAVRSYAFEIIDGALYGLVEPYGPKGPIIEQSPDSFSFKLRALTTTEEKDGKLVHNAVKIIAFDACQG